jgi:hypothetical protein
MEGLVALAIIRRGAERNHHLYDGRASLQFFYLVEFGHFLDHLVELFVEMGEITAPFSFDGTALVSPWN